MSKYIPAEKLIAEIERRKKEHFEIGGDTFETKWACGTLDNIKAFVISLQQEQPEVDFDEEFNKFHIGMYNPFDSGAEIYEFARHFWNKGYNARKEE